MAVHTTTSKRLKIFMFNFSAPKNRILSNLVIYVRVVSDDRMVLMIFHH